MKRIYTFNKKYTLLIIPVALFSCVLMYFCFQYAFPSQNNISTNLLKNPIILSLLIILPVFSVFYVLIKLTWVFILDNNVFTKKCLGLSIWSINISDITTIVPGYVPWFIGRGVGSYNSYGLILQDKNLKIYQTGIILNDPHQIIKDLQENNPNIEYQENKFLQPAPIFKDLQKQRVMRTFWIILALILLSIILRLLS